MKAGARAGGGLESKTIQKIYWKLSFEYLPIKNEAEQIAGAIARAGVKLYNMAEMLLSSVWAVLGSLFLPPKEGSEDYGKRRIEPLGGLNR